VHRAEAYRERVRRISNSFAMAGASWRVLQSDKELMVIPVMSLLCTLALAVLSGGAVYVSLDHHVAAAGASTEVAPTALTYVVGSVAYLLITFVVTFFAAALVAGARERLTGGKPSLGSAFSTASTRLPELFLWSLLTGTVGLLLNLIRSRSGVFGQVISRLVGMTWQVVTWLAVPVIVAEGTGPFRSLNRSAGLFRHTWGENLVGQIGFGLIGLLAMIPGVVIAALLMVNFAVAGILVGFVWIAATSVVVSTMSGIFRTALYQYASGAPIPEAFAHADLATAFQPRSGRGGQVSSLGL
jgi:Family of unknown function (DUF6159)